MIYVGDFKEIYVTVAPTALIMDLNFFKTAGEASIGAGFGALAAKSTALLGWYIAHVITDEPYCPAVSELAQCAIEQGCAALKGGYTRKILISALAELAVRASVPTQLLKTSRLVNGGEKHLAHTLQMLCAAENRPCRLYGEDLFLSAVFLSKLYLKYIGKQNSNDFTPPRPT